jgi:hypothetical protein
LPPARPPGRETSDSDPQRFHRTGVPDRRRELRAKRWLLAAALCVPTVAAAAQEPPPEPAPAEVTSRDWSFQALQDFASRGLVHGYRDAKFLEGKKLTRFEMASLVKRVVDSLLALPSPARGEKLESEEPGTAAARGQGRELPPLGRPQARPAAIRTAAFTENDLGTLKRLTSTYSVELAVIGVNLQEAMDRLTELEGRVETIEASLRDPEGALQTVISNVTRIDRVRFSGYVQARYESFEKTREAVPPDPRPGSRPNRAGEPAVTDRFTLRRVRLTVAGRPTDKLGVRWQLDGAGGSVETRDAWIDYYFTGNPATGHTATIGQMKVPFGFEVVQSSSVREAPERARVSRFFFPGERDRGFKIASGTGNRVFYEVGVFNGIGPGRSGVNTNDNNNDKDVAGRIRTTIAQRVDVGLSFNYGTMLRTARVNGEAPRVPFPISASAPQENAKIVYGADLQWFVRDGTVLRAEGMFGRAMGSDAHGYILQLLHNFGTKNQLVVKYDWFGVDQRVLAPVGGGGTPIGDAVPYEGTLSNLAIGWVHNLDSSTRVKLFYEMHRRGNSGLLYDAGFGKVPWQGNILRFEVITLF